MNTQDSFAGLRRLRASDPGDRDQIARAARRAADIDPAVDDEARRIVADVRRRGDAAVREHTESIEGRAPGARGGYEVDAGAWAEKVARVDPAVRRALERAAARIRAFHDTQLEGDRSALGGSARLRSVPVRRAGVYAPGGTARYPSSVLMTAIPASVAGVDEVALVTPDASPEALAAAELAGVTRAFELGGAQAVAALAYGTETVPRVDVIAGPGNAWVTAAKRAVYGEVGVDALAGPSEVLIVADESASPRFVAADLLAQAEHDRDARPVLIATSERVVDEVDAELTGQLTGLSRRAIAAEALARHGVAVLADSVDEAVSIAEEYAPEHLELAVAGAARVAESIRSAGAVFVGHYTPEAAGDYMAGPNHVLPTGGSARFASPLGVYSFRRWISVLELDRGELGALREDLVRLAEVEGLGAHARSVDVRFGGEDEAGGARGEGAS